MSNSVGQRGASRLIVILGIVVVVVIVVGAYGAGGFISYRNTVSKANDAIDASNADRSKVDDTFKAASAVTGKDTDTLASTLSKITDYQGKVGAAKDALNKDASRLRSARNDINQGFLTLPENSQIGKLQERLDLAAQSEDVASSSFDEISKDFDVFGAVVAMAKDVDDANTAVKASDLSKAGSALGTANDDVTKAKAAASSTTTAPELKSYLDDYSKLIDDYQRFVAALRNGNFSEVLRLEPIISREADAAGNPPTEKINEFYSSRFSELAKKYGDLVDRANRAT